MDTLCKFVRHLMEIASTNIVLYAVELNTCLISIMKDNQDTKVRKILRSADIRGGEGSRMQSFLEHA